MTGLRSSIIALCLALSLLMPMSAGGLVLCIGADGHIGFELARNSRCTSPSAPTLTPSQQLTQLTAQPEHCGPCIDVPVLTNAADAQQLASTFPPLLQFEMPGFALILWIVSASPELPLTSFWLSLPRVTNTTLSTLRTVILLL